MPRRVSSPQFVGRRGELAALVEALERAAGGEFAAVFVAGESGVGKSRLLRELEAAATERGARVLTGDCVGLAEGELPYAPIRAALRSLAAGLDADELDELLGPGRAELARLVPELGAAAAAAEPETGLAEPSAQAHLFELVLGLLGRLTGESSLVVVIEDIHWADRSTLDLIAFLLANARRERVLLVCSYRTDELHRRHPLRPFLARHERPPVERLDLPPFTREELAAQLEGILAAAPDAALIERLYERSGGNAFFTEELLAASAQATALPASLRDALMLRIEVLPVEAQQVLRLAATHGRVVTHRLLARACELTEPELDEAVREAAAHHVLKPSADDGYAFRHALLAETLEADLLPGERARLHLALAEALAEDPTLAARDGQAAAELCAHWLGAHRLPEALAAAVQAGIEAEGVYAFAEASDHFGRALELWDEVGDAEQRAGMDRVSLYARAAEAAHVSGDGTEAMALVRAAIDAIDADPYRAAALHERLGQYLFLASGDMEVAEQAFRQAVELLSIEEPRQELARALAGLGQVLMLRGRTEESAERCEQAIAVAREVGAGAEEAHALCTLGGAVAFRGEREKGIEHLRAGLRMAEELDKNHSLIRAYANLSELLDQDGRLEESAQIAIDGADRADELGMRNWRDLIRAEAATRVFKLGRLDQADELTRDALELRPSLSKLNQCAARARVEIHRGRADEAGALLLAAEEATPFVPGATWVEPLGTARVEHELLLGRPEEAVRAGEETLGRVAEGEQVVFTARLHAVTAGAAADWAERGRAAGDEAAAAEAASRAAALLARIDGLLSEGVWRGPAAPETLAQRGLCAVEAERAAGTATTDDWAAVADGWTELGFPLEEAYARLHMAEAALLGGERERAETAVAAGLAQARECGDDWLAERLGSLARRGRLRPGDESPAPARHAVDRFGLTDRELEVLELLTQGLTNREIGERLYMAQKTASVHVSRILTKLEVGSRVEAATTAQRLGIVP